MNVGIAEDVPQVAAGRIVAHIVTVVVVVVGGLSDQWHYP